MADFFFFGKNYLFDCDLNEDLEARKLTRFVVIFQMELEAI